MSTHAGARLYRAPQSPKYSSEAKKEGNTLPLQTRFVPVDELPTRSCVFTPKLGGSVLKNTMANFQRRSNFCPFERSSFAKKDQNPTDAETSLA